MCGNSFLFILLSCQIIDNFLATHTLANYLMIHSTNKSAIFASLRTASSAWRKFLILSFFSDLHLKNTRVSLENLVWLHPTVLTFCDDAR
jgi:hypothetical protein